MGKQVQINAATGLAAIFMLRSFESNMGNDVAGFDPKLAQALVDNGFAEPYDPEVHDPKTDKRGGFYTKTLDERKQEIEVMRRVQAETAEFVPAELQHEDMAEFRQWQAEQRLARQRFMPSTTNTREEIERSGLVTERAAPLIDTGLQETAELGAGATAATARAEETVESAPPTGDAEGKPAEEAPKPAGKAKTSDEAPKPPKA